MTYCTQQQMTDRFGLDELIQLTDRTTPPAGVVNVAVLDGAIADAGALIDGYLQARYPLPLPSVPLSLVRMCCDIARYYLYDDLATEQVVKRYNDAIDFLKQVAAGKASLSADSAGDQPPAQNSAQIISGGNVFDRQGAKGFI